MQGTKDIKTEIKKKKMYLIFEYLVTSNLQKKYRKPKRYRKCVIGGGNIKYAEGLRVS